MSHVQILISDSAEDRQNILNSFIKELIAGWNKIGLLDFYPYLFENQRMESG
ncbi:MAG TPA: hypothetical protein QF353_01165 [Gammaproteobacteria bacterium]|nr:hypothetical protein [Gammaproteobacteria bacterium]